MKEIKVHNEIVATSEYDVLGRQTKLIDVNAGTVEYEYNAFGDVVETINANGEVKTYTYDDYGRLEQTNNNGIIVNYEYVETGNGINEIEKISTNDHEELFEYDGLNRVVKTTEIINGNSFDFEYVYNSLSQAEQIIYPNGLVVNNIYDNNGYLIEVQDQNNTSLWQGLAQDALGRFVEYKKGDNVTTELFYDAFQNLAEIDAGNVQHHVYNWDNKTGNLMEREDLIKDLYEEFQYDHLNRLTKAQELEIAMGPPPHVFSEVEYEANGNIKYKSDVGDYAYHPTKPNAVTHVTNENENISILAQDITYNALNKASLINEGDGAYTLEFLYGHDKQRRKTTFNENSVLVMEKYFVGLYEKEFEPQTGITRHINYITAGDGMTAIVLQEEESGDVLPDETYFTYKDHLGSIVALTDDNGDVVLEQSFDAWGRYRNPDDWTFDNILESPTWLRGYTGHEHLPHFDLINMNGRVYDPILGRMLSPDKYIQDPLSSQSYNRYSYVWNNPLRYTDPSGDIVAFTDFGYAFWKYISPIAFKVNFNTGSSGTSIGIDASVGVPQKFQVHARAEGGISYHFSDNKNNYQGWEFRYGYEMGIGPIKSANVNYAFQDNKYNQSTNVITIGGPNINFKYENDFMFGLPADGGDRYRTAAGKLSYFEFSVGFNLYTGDPGLTNDERNPQNVNGQLTYLKNVHGDDPDEYRSGAAYFGFAGLKFGRNSEEIRHAIQNRFAHDIAFALVSGGEKLPHFAKDHNKKPSWYWNFGTGTGNSLW